MHHVVNEGRRLQISSVHLNLFLKFNLNARESERLSSKYVYLQLLRPAGLVELHVFEVCFGQIHDICKSFVELLIIRDGYHGALLRPDFCPLAADMIDLNLLNSLNYLVKIELKL